MIASTEFPLLDHIASGIFAIRQDGIIALWNKTLESWSGLDRQQMLGQSLYQHYPHLDHDAFKKRLAKLFDQGETLSFEAEAVQQLIPCPFEDGRPRYLMVSASLLATHQLAVFSLEDKTKQHELIDNYRDLAHTLQHELDHASELEQEKRVLLSAIDQAAEAVLICNSDFQIEYANNTFYKQTGWKPDELSNLKLPESLYIDIRGNLYQQLSQVFTQGKAWQGRQQSRRKDDSEFPASVSITPIMVDGKQIDHAVIIQEDVTVQNSMDEKLRRSQKQEALITLVGGIAHDFNNLLAGLVGQIYMITREVKGMTKTEERLRKSREIIEHATEIVRQLLTFARQGEHQATEFPLDSFIKEFYKLAQHSVPESIRLLLDFEAGNYNFRGDANQLQQSLLNIIQNAVEACQNKNNAEISIRLSLYHGGKENDLSIRHPVLRHGIFAHIAICDNGIGIPAENIENIFDPFFTTKQLGSGLGLAIVLGSIRLHHGIIDVESRQDEGTTFHLFLPLKQSKASNGEDLKQDTELSASILLVDDDPNVLEPTSELLISMGHRVAQARDGIEAVEKFKASSQQWDIVITDMVMPRQGGLEAAREIRAIRSDIPIIFSTGYDQSLVIADTRKMTNSVLISKPFNPDELDHMIVEMVRNSLSS